MVERAVITGFSSLSVLGSDPESYSAFLTKQRPIPQPHSHHECLNLAHWPIAKAFCIDGLSPTPITRWLDMYQKLHTCALEHAGLSDVPHTILGLGVGALNAQNIVDSLVRFDFESDPGFQTLDTYLGSHGSSTQSYWPWPNQDNFTILSTACTSGAQALGMALRMVRRGEYDKVLCGAVDTFSSDLVYAGFCILNVMSPTYTCKPFDRHRNGFVAGEGGALFIVESLSSALHRGADIYAEILGYGESNNAYRMTDIPDDGHGALLSMERALKDCGENPPCIDYVNAHGTGTLKNDAIEIRAIDRLGQKLGYTLPVGSTKSSHGHLIAAAGAIEAAMCLHSIGTSHLPPTLGLEDPELLMDHIHYVSQGGFHGELDTILSNSFGFGGGNASIVFRRYKT